jgi:hypothetical protein
VLLGRTPWTGRLPAGKRTVALQNKALGISSGRVLTLKGEPVSEKITFEKGTVVINAPPGAIVFMDGVRRGVAPLPGELAVYEGAHRAMVTVGESKWSESFTLFAGQRVQFDVSLEP